MSDNVLEISHAELPREIGDCLRVGLVPYIRSSPGIGKSDAAKEIARKLRLKVIDLRLSQCTPEDLQGFPMRDGNKAVFTPFSLFPLEGDELPVDDAGEMNGWMLLLDELSSANKSVQAAAYKLILDRQVGSFNLHEQCYMIACGNNITDKAVVHKMSTALQSRLIHFNLGHSVKDWVKWATLNDFDFRILAYVQFNQAMLMNFTPDHNDVTYACPRTWEFLNRMIKDKPVDREKDTAKVCGTIGRDAGMEFLTFCEVQKDIPDWDDVIDPKMNQKIPVPGEASARYATTSWIASKVDKTNVLQVLPYMQRFGADFQVIFCRGVLTRHKNLDRDVPDFGKYAMSTVTDLDSI